MKTEVPRSGAAREEDFLAVAAYIVHEIRSPLHVMSQAAPLIGGANLSETQQAALSAVQGQVTQIDRLVAGLGDFIGLRGTIDPHETVLSDVWLSVLSRVRPIVDAKRQDLVWELPTERIRLSALEDRLVQALTNILANASKYSDEGTQIRMTASVEPPWLTVRVCDDGAGIRREALPHVFELFYRSDEAREATPDGFGLGLAVTKKFIEVDGGTVQADSDGPGSGTEFVVRIRLATPYRDV
ncbi:MAG: HAMP domain-containing histidine kinase [Armatimonadetes bacterium]|nr:HAMP domain-containing histidine kinase [Armatimonadota bacterium]